MIETPPQSETSTSEVPPTFDALPLSHEVRKAVDALGFTHPTPVQRAVFESVAQGRDVVVQARTGTGKTAAFGLPIIDRIVDRERHKPQVLVLCPTRELALQIHRELELLGRFKGVKSTAIYGGAAMQPQIDAITDGTQIIAGTPGRVLDHLERGTLKTKSISALVLDESDEMLSMGFLPQITKIMERLPQSRQTLLFSATLPPDVKRIADSRLTDPEYITLSGDHVGALSIEHYVYRSMGRKAEELVQLIDIENPESAIIFCNTRDQTKQLATALQKQGFAADWLNADLSQKDREKVMAATREGRLRFLVCTDVAARGIDISHLTHVINADFPESTENYVHRTGRTGRAGRTGTAISLITPQDVGNLYMLRLTYKIFPIERDLPRPLEVQTRKETDLVHFLHQAFSATTTAAGDRSLARRILASEFAEVILAGLLADHLGAHPQAGEAALELRREALPTAAEDAPAKKKKKKKKKDKRKDDLEAADEHEADGHEPRVSQPDGAASDDIVASGAAGVGGSNQRPFNQRQEREVAEPVPEIPDATPDLASAIETAEVPRATPRKRAVSGPAARTRVEGERQVDEVRETEQLFGEALNGRSLSNEISEEMEVVRAADLLSPEERALLTGDDLEPEEEAQTSNGRSEADPTARVFVNVGARDAVVADDFLDTLADEGFPISTISDIVINDTHTFLSVPRGLLDEVLECFDGQDVAGLAIVAEEARRPRRSGPARRGPGAGPSRGPRGPRRRR